MRVILTTILSLFLLSLLPTFGLSQERPETIVIPVSSVGDVTETRKLILQNTLEDELKTHFRLISQDRFEETQEKAFEELEYEECTEERCIILIQEMLQVENVFHLQVIGEGNDTQLSLSWRTLDEKRKEEEFCEGCKTGELRKIIGGLVDEIIGVKEEVVAKPLVVETKEKGILFRDTPRSKWEEGGKKWFRSGDEKTQVKYEGEIVDGVPNGLGKITFFSENLYEGEWKDGDYHGQGTYIYSNGNRYIGEWKDGEKNGQGTSTFTDGTKYVGEWKNGKPNGQGTCTYPEGKYVGKWKNAKWNGKGTYTTPNGVKHEGEWLDGELWNGKKYDKSGNIYGRVVNGVEQE